MDAKAMFNLSYGLFVLSANDGERDNACIINTAIQVTSEPNRISIAVNKQNLTHDMIQKSGKFTVSILSEKAPFALFQRFGFQSGRDTDKFAGFENWKRGYNGTAIVTEGTNAFISAWVTDTVDLDTHTLFIAAVTDMEVLDDAPSATYRYYRSHIKPKPAAAPATDKTVWRCTVCGYEYEGEELPADFVCPLCKHPASDFEKVTK